MSFEERKHGLVDKVISKVLTAVLLPEDNPEPSPARRLPLADPERDSQPGSLTAQERAEYVRRQDEGD